MGLMWSVLGCSSSLLSSACYGIERHLQIMERYVVVFCIFGGQPDASLPRIGEVLWLRLSGSWCTVSLNYAVIGLLVDTAALVTAALQLMFTFILATVT